MPSALRRRYTSVGERGEGKARWAVFPRLVLASPSAVHPGRRRRRLSGDEQRSRHPEVACCSVED
jgi:hypothetical protein